MIFLYTCKEIQNIFRSKPYNGSPMKQLDVPEKTETAQTPICTVSVFSGTFLCARDTSILSEKILGDPILIYNVLACVCPTARRAMPIAPRRSSRPRAARGVAARRGSATRFLNSLKPVPALSNRSSPPPLSRCPLLQVRSAPLN